MCREKKLGVGDNFQVLEVPFETCIGKKLGVGDHYQVLKVSIGTCTRNLLLGVGDHFQVLKVAIYRHYICIHKHINRRPHCTFYINCLLLIVCAGLSRTLMEDDLEEEHRILEEELLQLDNIVEEEDLYNDYQRNGAQQHIARAQEWINSKGNIIDI